MSPLHVACLKGHIGVVRALLSAGAMVDQHDASPLCVACQEGHTEVLDFSLYGHKEVLDFSLYGHTEARWSTPCYPGGPRSTCRPPMG